MRKILIVGSGCAGFNTHGDLKGHFDGGEAQVTIVDPRP